MLRKSGREHGVVYTKPEVVSYLLDEVGYESSRDLSCVRLLEPASGHGAFALEILSRLYDSSQEFGFDFSSAMQSNLIFVEKNEKTYQTLQEILCSYLEELEVSIELDSWVRCSDFLTLENIGTFDCIVGNPPYIRHDNLEADYKAYLKAYYPTFKYRADLYIPFYEKGLNLLNPEGSLSFICSNRWLNNQYGAPLRNKISQGFHLKKLLNIEKSSPFDEEVIGYPCITTVSKSSGTHTLFHESLEKHIQFDILSYEKVETPHSGAWQNLFLPYDLNHSALAPLESQGLKIGIGVATGADKVFIGSKSKFAVLESSRVLPLLTSKCLQGESLQWDSSCVLNPFENNSLCDLNDYPEFHRYLEQHKETLSARYIAKKNPLQWYKTIDKIKPDLLSQPKLLLPDLAGASYLHIDKGEFYPHHNLYYVTHSSIEQLKILACILMSEFVREQLSQIGIRMNSGLPRLQAQTLRKLRIPNIQIISEDLKDKLLVAYDQRSFETINEVVNVYCERQEVFAKKQEPTRRIQKTYSRPKMEHQLEFVLV